MWWVKQVCSYQWLTILLHAGRPKKYVTGPRFADKSLRTQQEQIKSWKSQVSIKSWFNLDWNRDPLQPVTVEMALDTMDCQLSLKQKQKWEVDNQTSESQTSSVSNQPIELPEYSSPPHTQTWLGTVTIEEVEDEDEDEVPQNRDRAESDEDGSAMGDESSEQGPHPYTNLTKEQLKDWEAELDKDIEDPTKPTKDWRELQTQIKTHLKKNSRTMPLSQLNQYMILGNFFTLWIKGQHQIQASIKIARQWNQGHWGDSTFARWIHALACHYETFEKLSKEKPGGVRKARSWLHDEKVKKAVMEYFINVPVGKVTLWQLA